MKFKKCTKNYLEYYLNLIQHFRFKKLSSDIHQVKNKTHTQGGLLHSEPSSTAITLIFFFS